MENSKKATDVRELTCIQCPLGCQLTITGEGEDIVVRGNTCPRGEIYGKKEVTNPTRVVTSSVKLEGGLFARVSVKTKSDIPKGKIFQVMEEIRRVTLVSPVHIGDVVIENAAGTGVPVIVTKNA